MDANSNYKRCEMKVQQNWTDGSFTHRLVLSLLTTRRLGNVSNLGASHSWKSDNLSFEKNIRLQKRLQ